MSDSPHPSRFRINKKDAPVPVPRTNAELIEDWTAHLAGSAENTLRGALGDIRAFDRALDTLLFADVGPAEFRDYMAGYLSVCRSFQWGPNQPDRCTKRLDLAHCGPKCPGYELKLRESFMGHMRSIVDFYGFLVFKGRIPANFTRDVLKQYVQTIKWPKERQEVGYRPKLDEIRVFISGSEHEHRKAIYASMAKVGLRIHEVCLLKQEHVNLDTRWIFVPPEGKRTGNPWLPIDSELRRELEHFMDWRDRRPVSNTFFTNHKRQPLGKSLASRGHLNDKWWQADAIRLGLQSEEFLPPHLRWHTHSMRHFFSDSLSEAGCPDPWYGVLRGDKVKTKDNRGRYVDTGDKDRILQYYTRYAPVIGWK